MSKPVKIACIGEVMIELIAGSGDQATLGVAGDTYNTAVYLKNLSPDSTLEVSYVTALGGDSFSNRILSEISAHGIGTSLIERREGRMPGLYAIETDEKGERSFSYWRGQSAAKTLFEAPCEVTLEKLDGFDLIYISGISLAILPSSTRERFIDYLTHFRKDSGKVVFDSNYRPRLWESVDVAREVVMQMWSITDIALPSIDDEQTLFGEHSQGDVLLRLRDAGVTFGALKRGSDGPVAITNDGNLQISLDPVCEVVDSTAAGDSFNAGFISEIACGGTIKDAILKGHQIASKVIQKRGAIVALNL